MKTVYIRAYPYAIQEGYIDIPDNIKGNENIQKYLTDHFNEIKFGEPNLDYAGTDFDWEFE